MFPKVENPKIKNPKSLRRRFHVWLCKHFGHIKHGDYYGMVQAHCRRCGAETHWNATDEKWELPWGEYE